MDFLSDYALLIMLVIMVSITITGLPLGISMIVSSIFYLLLAGRDVGLAAENVLNGVFGNFVALAVPLFIFAANIIIGPNLNLNFVLSCAGYM